MLRLSLAPRNYTILNMIRNTPVAEREFHQRQLELKFVSCGTVRFEKILVLLQYLLPLSFE